MTPHDASELQPGALKGVKVVDLSRVLGGPFCGQILGDHGADVIKVEPPNGDETRGWGPPFDENGTSSYFLGVNRNKRSITLDLTTAKAQQTLKRLLADADVMIENFKIGTLEKWGFGRGFVETCFPRLIHCRVTGFGADGPLGGLPGYDAVLQGMCGLMSINGPADGEPMRIGLPIVDLVTGLNAAMGIMLALHHRTETGKGQFVEAALFDTALSLLHPHAANYFLSGKNSGRNGNDHANIAPYSTFATATCPIVIAVGNNRQFAKLCSLIGAPEIAQDSRFLSNDLRVRHRSELRSELELKLSYKDGADLANDLMENGVPAGPVFEIGEALANPHVLHRQMVTEFGGQKMMGNPLFMQRTPVSYRMRPPKLGEHSDEIVEDLESDRSATTDLE